MRILKGISQLEQPLKSSVVTVGNFDGVHLGHREILSRLITEASSKQVPSVLLTFHPHPREVLTPHRPFSRIFHQSDQVEQTEQMGLDYLVFEPFSRKLSQVSPERFLTDWIDRIGRGNAAAFDDYSWSYYTRDVFDLFYPGYWDSYPSFHGATGMTYETDGGGSKGMRWRRDDGTVLTFEDGIAHHFVAALATMLWVGTSLAVAGVVETAASVRSQVRRAADTARSMVFGPAAFRGEDEADEGFAELRERMERVEAALRNPERTGFRVVFRPEALVIAETRQLVEEPSIELEVVFGKPLDLISMRAHVRCSVRRLPRR